MSSCMFPCLFLVRQDRKMLSIAQQMLQDSRTKIELLRMQIIKVRQARNGGNGGSDGTVLWKQPLFYCSSHLHRKPLLLCQVKRRI